MSRRHELAAGVSEPFPDAGEPAAGVVVALRALGLGDLLTALPALRGLRRYVRAQLPGHRLLLAGQRWLEPVVMLSGAVDGLVRTAPLGPVAVAEPTLAVNLHGRGPESTATLRRTRPSALWAFDLAGGCPWRRPVSARTRRVATETGEGASGKAETVGWDEEHEVSRWCRLLAAHGVSCDLAELDLPVPARPLAVKVPGTELDGCGEFGDEGDLTMVHPGGAAPARRWPAPRWSVVVRHLARDGHQVVLTGSARERGLAMRVAAAAGLPASAVLAGRLDLVTLCRLVAHARLVISSDTGVAHLATAYRRPSVVLFGPVSPAEWGPPPERPMHRGLWAGQRSNPRSGDPAPGLLAITADQVLCEATSLALRSPVRPIPLHELAG